jgi:carotenoid cleavage dioxygenase
VFHAANAYRNDQEQIILDVLVHDTDFEHSQHAAYEQQQAVLERWIVTSDLRQIKRSQLDCRIQEFPKIDMRSNGMAYRYLYTLSFPKSGLFNFLIIHDLVSQQSVSYDFGEQWAIGEVSFVEKQVDCSEGDGYLMMYIHHVEGRDSKVVILKVNGLEIQEQAEIALGVRVPLGFHCNWVPDAS